MPVVRADDLDFAGLPGRMSADPLRAASASTAKDAGCSVRVVRIAPGPRRPHVHAHSAEVAYVVEGEGRAWEGDVATAVAGGDVLLIPAGTPHATVASGSSDLVLVCFFPHSDLAANLEELEGPPRT